MKTKVMSYNILDGGCWNLVKNNGQTNYKYAPERLNAAKLAVKAEDPDILVLAEACFSSKSGHGFAMNFSTEFGFNDYFHFQADYNHHRGIAVLSKFPIIEEINKSRGLHGFARTQIDIKGLRIHLDALHPHPTDANEEGKAYLFSEVLSEMHNPYLLLGDFNSLSPDDHYERAKLIEGFQKLKNQQPEKTVDDLLKRLAVKEVKSHGLIDTFIASKRPWAHTISTNLNPKNDEAATRRDFIFCSPDFNVLDSYVLNNDLTNRASDHYPVVAVLEI